MLLNPISPIKQSQEEVIDTLYCLNVPYTLDYGQTKQGRKTRIIRTKSDVLEFFFMDKLKYNGKVSTTYDVKRSLINKYI